jgi:lysozyme
MLNQTREMAGLAATQLLRGVDVASYQGAPGSWSAQAGRISFAAVKFTELQPPPAAPVPYVNPYAAADWAYLHQHKLGRVAYLFAHPSVGVTATVNLFAKEVTKLGLADNDAIAVDLEVTDGRSPSAVDTWAAELLAALAKKYQRPPLVYTYLSFAEAGNCAKLGKYPLWISNPSRPAGQPQIPAPWTKWALHQYATPSGQIDRDVANYPTLAAMARALGKSKGPDMKNIGGSMSSALASVRWPDQVTIVAGLGTDGFVQATRWDAGKWGAWKNVSPTKAKGAPGLLAWGTGNGRLYYTDAASGNVIVLETTNGGRTWT